MNNTTKIKRQFYHALKRGTGEAYLVAKNNPSIDFSNYIIKGALKNFAYDGQSEDSRAKYIFDIISISKNKDKIRSAILKGLATEQGDTWSLTHLFDLTKIYAKRGDVEARKAIYDRFLNNPIAYSDWVGYEAILELDGLEGLLYIAEKFGKFIQQNPEDHQDSSIIKYFQDKNPHVNAFKKLEEAAETNLYIRIYLANIYKLEKGLKKIKRKAENYDTIIDEILEGKPFFPFNLRKRIDKLELNKIGERLLIERDKSNIEKLLRVFVYQKFPFDSNFILMLAKQRATPKNRINEFAIYALQYLGSKDIREFALERVLKTRNPAMFTDILMSNYKNGDFKLLSTIAKKFKNEHIIETLAISYSDIFKLNKTIECKEPLEILYGKMNCGIHRNSIIEILLNNNVLSNRIRQEARYDSYLKTRELIV